MDLQNLFTNQIKQDLVLDKQQSLIKHKIKPSQTTYTRTHPHTHIYEVDTISFQTFFVWAFLLIVHTWNSCPLQGNFLRLQCTCFTVTTTSGRPHKNPLVWACQWSSSQPLLSPQLSHNDSLWAKGITKSQREQGLDYREAEELSWCPSWSNSLWQGWSCGLVHCPGGNATEPIWRALASSQGISSWTPLKPQQSNPNPNPNTLANQLWCIDFLIPPTPLIIPHRLSALLEYLMLLKNWCSIHARCFKSSLKCSIRFSGMFPSLKQNFIAYRSSKVSDFIFENHQLWQSGFSRVCSNCCCSCSFEAGIIKIGQSSHQMYNNSILNSQESTTILNAHTKKVWKLIVCTSYICI